MSILSEMNKLTEVDFRVASWLSNDNPNALLPYLQFITDNYYLRRGQRLDVQVLFDEFSRPEKSGNFIIL